MNRPGENTLTERDAPSIKNVAEEFRLPFPQWAVRQLLKAGRAATFPLRMMPDFIIIGSQRGGTTSLYRYLLRHPDIGSAFRKEIDFFNFNFRKGLPWYRSHFPLSLNRMVNRRYITGESSPDYLYHPHAVGRIRKTVPGIKLIVMLRNPVDRAYSLYKWNVKVGYETLPTFEEAVEKEEERIRDEWKRVCENEDYHSYNVLHYSYLDRGRYADQMERVLNLFPREQVLILKSEEFYREPRAVFKRTLRFLDRHEIDLTDAKKYNYVRYEEMSRSTRERLAEYFKPCNQRLYELTGEDFGWEKC